MVGHFDLERQKDFPGSIQLCRPASTHNLILVTRNECDFTPGQITLINPWKKEKQEKVDSQKKETEI
jgi:hypothetical protein